MPLPTAYEITDGLRTAFDNRSNSSYPNVEKDSLILAAVILAQQYVGVSLSCVVGKEADDTTFGLDELCLKMSSWRLLRLPRSLTMDGETLQEIPLL